MFQESSLAKKRIAHESNNLPVRKLPEPKSRVNHMQNAMQSVYLRQEIVRKQQLEAKKLEETNKTHSVSDTLINSQSSSSKPISTGILQSTLTSLN